MLVATWLVALTLGLLTTGTTQWQNLVTGLSQVSDTGAYRFSPSGNEWRLRTWHAVGVRRFELKRTYTRNDSIDPAADARAAFPDLGRAAGIDLGVPPKITANSVEWSSLAWGWPARHTMLDSRGRRHILPAGFALNTLAFTPVWYLALHLLRAPVAFIIRRFRRPEWECRRCRYDLRGIPEDAPCPECGQEPGRGRTA